MGKGEFPRPVRLGSMSVAWSSQEINNWIAQRLVQREEQL
jgi:predicted DNA-binding transcriptional regulator AlpA